MPLTKNLLAVVLFAGFTHAAQAAQPAPASAQRLEAVAQRGAHVMPFDLERTQHRFTKGPLGGHQSVEVKDPNDLEQIKLIRAHLAKIAKEFEQGQFIAPAAIHGSQMPGLRELSAAGPGELKIRWRKLPLGAKIDYQSQKPELVAALHQWFDAQVSDHGHHAKAGHGHQHGH